MSLLVSVIAIVVVVILFLVIIINVRVVSQANSLVIERLGTYSRTLGNGIHFTIPIIDNVRGGKIILKEQVIDFKPQPVITKDNVTMQIDTVIYFQISDPKLYVYGIEKPMSALENLTATTLRNIIGELELDQSLTSRDIINSRMRIVLDEATDPWGMKVNRVELKNILPPKDIQEAMEKQMRAEREKRSSILLAEGEKQAAILSAEGRKQAQILNAEGEKEAKILAADALKIAIIREAEGNAESILKVNAATAEGLKLIKLAKVDEGVIALKSFEALEKMADGQATKIIVPSNLQSIAGMATALKEFVVDK
jgi:regulator of protease activity HflC (stomatin/prohibitin superfamily)